MDTQNVNPQPEKEGDYLTLNIEGTSAKKSVKKWPVITAIMIALLAIAAVVTVIIVKNLNKNEENRVITIVDVEREAGNHGLFDSFTYEGPVGQSTRICFDIDDLALSMIKKQYPDLEILEELNGLVLNTSFEKKDNMARIVIGAELDEESDTSVEFVLDADTESLYISSDQFSGNYLKLDVSSIEQTDAVADVIELLLDAIMNSELNDRYFNSFLELMTAQETKKEIITVNGVSQECTVYSAQIDINYLANLCIDYLEELKQDSGSVTDYFDSAIDAIQETLLGEENSWILYWNVYTDASGKIIGRDIRNDDEKFLSYITTTDNEDIGFIFSVSAFEISGNAVMKAGLLDGTFIVSEDDVDYLKISAEEFDLEAWKSGMPNGTIEFEPTDELFSELFDISIGLPVSITIDFKSSEEDTSIVLSLMELATISVDVSRYIPESISLPEGNEIDANDIDAFSELFGSSSTGAVI